MRWKYAVLLIFFAYLQYDLWLSQSNVLDGWHLHQKIQEQLAENAKLKARNQLLIADVLDLKQGTAAIEEYARGELGMIKKNEVFFLLAE